LVVGYGINQQLRKTKLTGKTAEIDYAPLGKELVRYKEHGQRIKKRSK
jgi:hypothetical protein